MSRQRSVSDNHHHGESETAIFVRSGNPAFVFHDGHGEVRIATAPGDYVFVPPYVPHREENPDPGNPAVIVIARSTQEAIVVNLPALYALPDEPRKGTGLMLFRQLEYFVAVASEQHFARAAEACYVSQPALSASIAKLERELNVTLINRGHKYQGLTAEGERLVVWAKRILAEQQAFKAEAAAVKSGITGTLRLGAEPTASTTLALPVAAFCAAHPLARVTVDSRVSTTELGRQLREFELDVAIAHFAQRSARACRWCRCTRRDTSCLRPAIS